MRGGTRGGGRGLSRTLGFERNGYESSEFDRGDNGSIDLSQFEDIDHANSPIRRVRPREPRQDTYVKSDYDSQRKVFEHTCIICTCIFDGHMNEIAYSLVLYTISPSLYYQ